MILSTNQELRLHVPSNAFDEVMLLQGIVNTSEKDFLRDKLGQPLYDRLCEYYRESVNPDEFYLDVSNGTYTQHPWNELLFNAQSMVANDAMARYAYQQLLSMNMAGVNVSTSNDYPAASDKLLDKGVQKYKENALVSLNTMLVLLEGWAKLTQPMPISVPNTDDNVQKTDDSVQKTDETVQETDNSVQIAEIEEIVALWQQSDYFYWHQDLLIPTCTILNKYLENFHESRYKFIMLLPDIRFIQDEYIADAFGNDFIAEMLQADDKDILLIKTRRLIVAHLKVRTSVIAYDKFTRQTAHDDAISLRDSILRILADRKAAEQPADATPTTEATDNDNQSYKNNQQGSRMFVSPLLY